MRALALDMGGIHIGYCVVDEDLLLAHTSIHAEGALSLADLLPVVAATLRTLLREVDMTAQKCAGVAMGFPGGL